MAVVIPMLLKVGVHVFLYVCLYVCKCLCMHVAQGCGFQIICPTV